MKYRLLLVICSACLAGCSEIETTYHKTEKNNAFQPILVNQSGYNLEWPKRFTAPLCPDGTVFVVTRKNSNKILYYGTVTQGVGDFSDFKPAASGVEYVIKIDTEPTAGSDPFQIEPSWMQQVCLEPALRFMVDCRSVTGTHPSAYGGAPWRDGTYYSYEVPSLVMLYLSNMPYFDTLPVEIDYDNDKQRILDPLFELVPAKQDEHALATARAYYTGLDGPIGKNVPDIVQLIHWGIGWYLCNPQLHDPSGNYSDPEGSKIHPQTVEQFAYFLYGYPCYQKYFTAAFYRKAHEFAFSHWDKVGLFNVFETVGTFKGRQCPGHSIMPNLMMYEVAKRTGHADADRFMQAAKKQTQWVIDRLDFNDPLVTKGQRMSEHKLITGLAFFLKNYPEDAPPELKTKLTQWVEIVIMRSDNMWDFRRYDNDNWSLPRFTPGQTEHGGAGWNEPGNVAGFPACCFAVMSVLDDKTQKHRLLEIATAHFDDLFGRNPLGVHSASRGPQYFVGVERGWPKKFGENVCARLELVRGTLNATCNTEQYPYNPVPEFRHVEGWTAFNAAFNVSLAYACQMNDSKPNCIQE